MSLINQVLRDLDRLAPSAPGAAATAHLVATRAAPARHRAAIALVGVGLCVGALGWAGGFPARSSTAAVAGGTSMGGGGATAPAPTVVAVVSPGPGGSLVGDGAPGTWSFSAGTLRADTLPDAAQPPGFEADPTEVAMAPGAPPAAPATPVRLGAWLEERDRGGTGAVGLADFFPGTGTGVARLAADAAAVDAPASAPPAVAPPVPTGPVRIEKRVAATTPAERAEAASRRGAAAQERGDPAEAAREYAAALEADPGAAAARAALAGVWLAQGRAADAEALLQAGLSPGPPQAGLAMPLARLLAARDALPAAIGVLRAGLAGAGAAGSADYRACFGAILQRAGQHREAAEQFGAALRLAPGNGVWWMGLAISLAAENEPDAARTAYRQALAVGGLSGELAQFVEQRLRQLP